MKVGDYMHFTLLGGAPWGFSLRDGDGDTFKPFQISKVDKGGHAYVAGVLEGDEVVSLNGETCLDLNLHQACAMMDTTQDCLHLLVKRYNISTNPAQQSQTLGSAFVIEEYPSSIQSNENIYKTTKTFLGRKPCGQYGELFSSPSTLRLVNVLLQQPSDLGRGIQSLEKVLGRPEVSRDPSEAEEGERGPSPVPPESFGVPFRVLSEEDDSDAEGVQDAPTKHRAKTARLRRSESQSEKQLKDAKSKCKRIALLLAAAPNNLNNKGVLMFKKHQQRAKRYTLVSYGTAEDKSKYSSEEDDSLQDNSQIKDPLNTPLERVGREKGQAEEVAMECLPDTKGKGALMFAQRRQRMDEIAAEHEELRRQGIPVEGMQDSIKMKVNQSSMTSTRDDNTYLDVNIHQQGQQNHEQQYFEQQHHYQLQDHHQQQQLQQEQYQQQFTLHHQSHYQQHEEGLYPPQQMYKQEFNQQTHHLASVPSQQQNIAEMQSLYGNRTAKPFSVQNMEATTCTGQGEQIASRDERISTPAIRTGLLDSKKRNAGKPMFTFKEAPKVSPNPALLNLLNKGDKKLGIDFAAEEDYLSLGAEACNFLQSSDVKSKVPPPVAPKPLINPDSPAWTSQMQTSNQEIPQLAESNASTPLAHPTKENASKLLIPEPLAESRAIPELKECVTRETTEEQGKLTPVEQQPVPAHEDHCQVITTTQSDKVPLRDLSSKQAKNPPGVSWCPTQSQQHHGRQSPQQQSWVTEQPLSQGQGQPQTVNWDPQFNTSWSQTQENREVHPNVSSTWSQPQGKTPTLVQPPWVQSQEAHPQEQQPMWSPQQESVQQPLRDSWLEGETQPQVPRVPQCEQKLEVQPPWAKPSLTASQQQPSWMHQQQATHQTWHNAQMPVQNQTQWSPSQDQTQQQHIPTNVWPMMQPHAQPHSPWIQAIPVQAHSQAQLNTWAPMGARGHQTHPQQTLSQNAGGQHNMKSWEVGNIPDHQTWNQPTCAEPKSQPNWQQASSFSPHRQTTSAQPLISQSSWVPESQQHSPSSSKRWDAPQNSPSSQTPRRVNTSPSVTKDSSPVNPMATVLIPSSTSAYEMPPVRGKGADMFAKRHSRMEKFVVDSETVEANKASRSTSPAASIPNEWKYSPNVRAPPPRAYNPIQSPFYPPAAIKQPHSSGPSTKIKSKDKDQQLKPASKPLNVVDVMKHQPYQLNASLFTFGPAVEVAKETVPKPDCLPVNQSIDCQPVSYEQVTNSQSVQYPLQMYGIPMQSDVHGGQQLPNAYSQVNPFQQPAPGPYQQVYPQQYQQPSTFEPPPGQSLNLAYSQSHPPYQTQNSGPPYFANPSIQQLDNIYGSSRVQAEFSPSSNPVTAPKPKYTAKSTALVWKPAGVEKQ